MRVLDIPSDMTVDLGYRQLDIKAGKRAYPDEVANAKGMDRYWVQDDQPPAPAPAAPPAKPGKGDDQ